MKTREYLRIQKAEIIIRFEFITIQPPIKYGYYELKIDQDWISVYVNIPIIETAAKPLYRMELSSSDKRFPTLLRVYKRVMEETSLLLRDSFGEIYQVEYSSLQKLNKIYVGGNFLVEKREWDPDLPNLFPFLCRLTDGKELLGVAGETFRGEERVLFLDMDEISVKDTVKLLQELAQGELLLEEIIE